MAIWNYGLMLLVLSFFFTKSARWLPLISSAFSCNILNIYSGKKVGELIDDAFMLVSSYLYTQCCMFSPTKNIAAHRKTNLILHNATRKKLCGLMKPRLYCLHQYKWCKTKETQTNMETPIQQWSMVEEAS